MARTPTRTLRSRRHGTYALALLATMALLVAAAPAAAQSAFFAVEIVPDQPRAQQAVHATIAVPESYTPGDVSHVQGVIEIGMRRTGGFPRPGTRPMSVTLGKLPQGTYRLRVVNAAEPTRPPLAPEQTFTVAPPAPSASPQDYQPLLDYSGWWTRADTDSGEGWLVEHKGPDRLMFSWVTYDDAGNPNWFVMQSTQRQSGGVLIGPVYRARREDGTIVRTLVGEGRFLADGIDQALFVLTPANPPLGAVSTPLRRLAF
jgi:hypothetical protein